jgi:hypothetical protein
VEAVVDRTNGLLLVNRQNSSVDTIAATSWRSTGPPIVVVLGLSCRFFLSYGVPIIPSRALALGSRRWIQDVKVCRAPIFVKNPDWNFWDKT